MLIVSKTSLKKIAIYFTIMTVMFLGTGFMIYGNFIKGKATVSYPAEIAGQDEGGILPLSGAAVAPAEIVGQDVPAVKTKKARAIKNIELTEDKRYKNLKEIILEPASGKIGKDNPFASYIP
jgi:hypothetical protein